ncbi:MAG TPA: type VI secretion system membrane subunit TssM [Pyrinomonadaceae bacterium]|nr:type VI secretion system membrane subunit TssM [Pyrinomonadaceae bacterium]
MSSWHTSQLTWALGLGGMMSFYGIVSVIVYFMPASTASYNDKIVIIALVLLTLPFALLFMFVKSRREKKRAKAEAAAADAAEQGAAAPTAQPVQQAAVGSYPEIDAAFQELATFLKGSNLGKDGKDALYSLPWYLIAGPLRSGKSSLFISAGLDLKTLPSQRESEQKTIRPTPNIDLRVTSEGVFIDTSGRFQSEGGPADEWSALLETIKKIRPARPIDGFILVVNGDKIIKREEAESEETAKVLRGRLDDAIQRIKLRFPVYLVFTHSDAIEGFQDSFSVSKNEGRELVWGATIPFANAESAQAQFDTEFELLRDSAMKRRILRLSAPFTPVRQLKIFNFPLHFGAARRRIGAFVGALFRPNPFSENPLLRGFYFTSTLARRGQNTPATVAAAYFTPRLFRDVFLRDADVVRAFQAQKQSGPILAWLALVAIIGLSALLVILSGVSLYNNKQLLSEAQTRGEKVIAITRTDAYKNPGKADETAIRNELNATEDLRYLLKDLDDYERHGAPLFMRMGLYSGNRPYRKHLLPVYMAVIENRFKAPALKRLTADLKKFADTATVANPAKLTDQEEQTLGKNYDLLKAYLMLTGQYKDKAEPSHIAATLKPYWTADDKIPVDMKPVALDQLAFWAKQVDRDDPDGYQFPRIQIDEKLVGDARKKLQAFPAVYRYYKRQVTEISKTIDDKIGPFTTEGILSRAGGDPRFIEGTFQVPGAYTRSGLKLMKTAITDANDKLAEGDWVMGESGRSSLAQTTDSKLIEDRYYRDYVDNWRAFIKGTNVKPYKDKDTATASLQVFSLENSPMKLLLKEVAYNTNLSARSENESWWEWIKSWFVSGPADGDGNTPPEKAFRPLFAFVGKKTDKDKAPIDSYGSEIQAIYKKLGRYNADQLKTIASDLANGKDSELGIGRSEGNIDGMIGGFSETAASQEVAELLKEPLGNLRAMLGGDAQAQLKKLWAEQILPAAKDIEKGYPFDDGAGESDLTKLSAFLNPVDGKLSVFYNDKLKKYFEEANGQLKLKTDSEVKFTPEFVAYLNNAFALRQALYGTSQTPKFEYEFSFKPSKTAIVEITIDGQKITSDGTASIKGTFPAPAGAETGVVLDSGSGGTTSSAPAGNANTASAPASNSGTQRFPGQWGLFRFVDAGKPSKQPTGEYSISYSVGGHPVSAQIKPSGGDLFDKSVFRNVKAPDNLIQ